MFTNFKVTENAVLSSKILVITQEIVPIETTGYNIYVYFLTTPFSTLFSKIYPLNPQDR